jgi:alkane 1-monooxygenase
MNHWKWMKYLLAFLAPAGVLAGMVMGGWVPFIPLGFAFVLIPFLELIINPDPRNADEAEAELRSKAPVYDFLLYLLLPVQYLILYLFLDGIANDNLVVIIGKTLSMGLLCGIVGINLGHELGHRSGHKDLVFAKLFLLSSLYMHFYIEHNRGHHKRVGTHLDPASARFGESIYFFWIRSISGSYLSAWKLELDRLRSKGLAPFSIRNEMVQIHGIELLFLALILFLFGLKSLILFMTASLLGILLLESVNYIEHYGLGRRIREDGSFVKTLHCHSWNSDHVLSRILLFELSRHSDHHYKASKKYQVLNHHDESPQMPTGYAGMIILALIPPLWYRVMHPILNHEQQRFPDLVKAM